MGEMADFCNNVALDWMDAEAWGFVFDPQDVYEPRYVKLTLEEHIAQLRRKYPKPTCDKIAKELRSA
jgi:hypothetical protein